MLNFAPTEEQEEIRRLAHSVASEQLRPAGRGAEKSGEIPPELLRTLMQTGLTTPFPEALGGAGVSDAVTYALIAEELGFGDSGLAINIVGSLMGPLAVLLAGSASQQERFITPFCDQRQGYMHSGSLAFAERTGGYSLAEVNAVARPQGEGYILNGVKRDVIHGLRSHARIVLLRLEGSTGLAGLCAAVLAEQPAGMQIEADAQKLGMLAAPSAAFSFERVQIPASWLLGEPGNPGVIRAAAMYSILRASVACGTARAALEYASDYAGERVAFGRPIASYQGIAFMIAEMAMKLDAARLLTWRAAASWDRQEELLTLIRQAEAAQRQAITIAQAATIDAVQIMGGAGFMQDHPAEMWMRNAAAME
jgi:alkylation response protein AidB-like acyl-CoA dehydrogenase